MTRHGFMTRFTMRSINSAPGTPSMKYTSTSLISLTSICRKCCKTMHVSGLPASRSSPFVSLSPLFQSNSNRTMSRLRSQKLSLPSPSNSRWLKSSKQKLRDVKLVSRPNPKPKLRQSRCKRKLPARKQRSRWKPSRMKSIVWEKTEEPMQSITPSSSKLKLSRPNSRHSTFKSLRSNLSWTTPRCTSETVSLPTWVRIWVTSRSLWILWLRERHQERSQEEYLDLLSLTYWVITVLISLIIKVLLHFNYYLSIN